MADAAYSSVGTGAASWSSRPCNFGRCFISCIRQDASTQGPPTSRAVLVNQAEAFIAGSFTVKSPANRVRGATASGYVGGRVQDAELLCQGRGNAVGDAKVSAALLFSRSSADCIGQCNLKGAEALAAPFHHEVSAADWLQFLLAAGHWLC